MSEHRLVDDTLVRESDGIYAYCTCGKKIGPHFSSMLASSYFRDHQENARREVLANG